MKILGVGIDIVDKMQVAKLIKKDVFGHFLKKWFTTEEREYLLKSKNIVNEFSIIFSIKESFIKASSGNITLKDMKNINVSKFNYKYKISYTKDEKFSLDKYYMITNSAIKSLVISSVVILEK
ncbi:4'-phosphopantetheinyl transferase family protein [Sporosarcina limicola]|uniref:Phosphopantetheine--protein transferase-like protein n=1 Tax=Sporosarcina limicola TaxID=34101 RepID=A0A927MLG5_9BACL|nr:4'-phosphopantetheinyl transferase superfamily protein [Sporosarcina limicola]MBE1555102.1 phosphopantetheine--protein transferase-like protein [Sporosarcina limicola]